MLPAVDLRLARCVD